MDPELTRAQWRRLGASIYLPTALSMVGHSAVTPLLPLTARDLGSSVAEAALLVAFLGVGVLVGALPAGSITARFGEKRVLVGACVLDAGLLLAAAGAPHVAALWAISFALGLVGAVFGLARQGYLTVAVPARYRARAMSTLGGVFRVGAFVGPLLGAAAVTAWGLRAGYLLAVTASLAAAVVTLRLPDLPGPSTDPDAAGGGAPASEPPATLVTVLRAHLGIYATVGLGAAALMLVRTARDSLVPLWADHIGLHPAETSLVFGLGAGADMLLFYFGGSLMDRHGRRAVATPAMLVMGTCLALLPLTDGFWTLLLVAIGLGLGNGISAGVVLTLGSDHAPAHGMAQFLGGWRLTTGVGQAAGPLLIAGIAAVAPLAAACVAMGAIGWVGGAWLWRWARPQAAGQ